MLLAAGLALGSCRPSGQPGGETGGHSTATWWEIDSPVGALSFAPHLEEVEGELLLSWLETVEADANRHRLMVSRRRAGAWTRPSQIASGPDFFANWADIPKVVATGGDALLAHWLAKTAADTYAYSIYLARSEDGGDSWQPLGRLNDDETATEHGFVSWVAEGRGARAFWLDGREMGGGGDMALRTAFVGEGVGASEALDDRVCECCATAAAVVERGPLVVYRDRSASEIRDIGLLRRVADSWVGPTRVARDDWRIEGCPVNGPEVATLGNRVVVVWYTAAGERPGVELARSEDGGETFGPPLTVDGGRPLGRGDVVEDGRGGFLISWLEGADERAEIRLRRLSESGALGAPLVVARTSPSRASGFPKLIRVGSDCFLAWVDVDEPETSRIRLLQIPLDAVS